MNKDISDIDLEISALLDGLNFDPNEDIDDSPTLKRTSANLDTDYDGTPIIGTEKKSKNKPIKPKASVKSGKGRPKNRTIDVSNYTDRNKKLAFIYSAIVAKFSEQTISLLQYKNRLEILFIENDGHSSCDRIRFYIGEADKNAHGRDKCKGRKNVYERKGDFPIVDLILSIAGEIQQLNI